MTALPMTLEGALRREGYTIDTEVTTELSITLPTGTLTFPPAAISVLTWARVEPPIRGDALYLDALPLFDEAYRPILLSQILDRFRTRRLAYNTPGEFRLAVRRWGNLSMTLFNQRYLSMAVAMPLDDTALTDHTLDVSSDFPQSLIAAENDYATSALDHRAADNGRHRSIASLLMEQRQAYLNVDAEVIDAMESLFLGVFDRGEMGEPDYAPPYGGLPGFYNTPPYYGSGPFYDC